VSAQGSPAFERLAEPVRRWVWRQGWTALRDVQDRAIAPLLTGRDVVIASATASGKTEAAFLPLLSRPVERDGLRLLYVSPLKALINDQARRLEPLAKAVGLPVTPWHGDVEATRKQRLRKDPSGVLLITPESLEAMFVLRGTAVAALFGGLDYVVIDELHSFIASERGRQLQSLLHRVELVTGRPVPRAGLSATLGDLGAAAEFLRPGGEVEIVESRVSRREVRVQIRGLLEAAEGDDDANDPEPGEVAEHLYRIVRGGTHIVFANARATVEQTVHDLKRLGERQREPDEIWPHHGSLAKDVREDAEAALRSERPATVVATTTLELGIDVGSVDTIAQIGPPPSVASMRQRLGRSGRRPGDPSELRIYIEEDRLDARAAPQDQLRDRLVQAVAMVDLLIDGHNESPHPGALHLSTLVQQVLSLIAQRGGVRADDAWRALCWTGPFMAVDSATFGALLRGLAKWDLVVQTHDGTIVLGLDGERLINRYDFYTAFVTFEEYRLVVGPRTLGTLPISRPVQVGDLMLFAGRRWRVLEVRDRERIIELEPAPGGRAPKFEGGGMLVDDAVRRRMRGVYLAGGAPSYLDSGGRRLLDDGRRAFTRLALADAPLLTWGQDVVAFPWAGDRILNTLALLLRREGLEGVTADGVAVVAPQAGVEDVQRALGSVVASPIDAVEIAASVENKLVEKYHWTLGEALLAADYASSRLDVAGAVAAARRVLGDE
jgi:ATP-dependent Lhr-like helicase